MPETNTSALRASGQAADEGFSNSAPENVIEPCPRATDWVEIQLVGEDDEGIPGAAYRIELDDGRVILGKLDENGVGAVAGIKPGDCVVSFPELDGEAWEPTRAASTAGGAP